MSNTNPFGGIDEPTTPQSEIRNISSEEVELGLKQLITETELEEQKLERNHRQNTSAFLLRGSLVGLALLLLVGLVTNDYEAAQIWWMFIGPLVGYTLQIVLGR